MYKNKIIFFFIIFLLFSNLIYADQKDSRLDDLFDELFLSSNNVQSNIILSDIWSIWHMADNEETQLTFDKAIQFMDRGDFENSIKLFTKAIDQSPDFAEAWNKRATVYYMIGDFDSSMTDINETLKLEPRHFGAMDGMSLIFININEFKKAIHVYDQMLNIFPKNHSIIKKRDYILNKISKST